MTDYEKYRGKCKQLSEEAVRNNPELRLVRGHYYCTSWGKEAHWWTVKPNGEILTQLKTSFHLEVWVIMKNMMALPIVLSVAKEQVRQLVL